MTMLDLPLAATVIVGVGSNSCDNAKLPNAAIAEMILAWVDMVLGVNIVFPNGILSIIFQT